MLTLVELKGIMGTETEGRALPRQIRERVVSPIQSSILGIC